jgi:hypothetical protein
MKPWARASGAPPRTPRGLRPCDPPWENQTSHEGKTNAHSLPLVGADLYTLFGCLSRPWVTFSFDPTETGLGYIVK